MRVTLFAAASALALATPAAVAAQEQPVETSASDLADRLSDPAEQERLAGMFAALGEIMLELPVGPMLEATTRAAGEDAPDIDRDARLRDLAGPEAERLPEEISEKVPQVMGMMAGMAEGIETMRPLLEAWAETMREQIRHGGSH